MVLVSINVMQVELMINAIRAFATALKDEHNAAVPAADDALIPTHDLRSDQEWFDRLNQMASDLRQRVDLAVAINGNSMMGTLGLPITYETPGNSDTLEDMRMMVVGLKLAADLTDAVAEGDAESLDAALATMKQYSQDETVMNVLYGELGAQGVVDLANYFVVDGDDDLTADSEDAQRNRARMDVLIGGLATYTASEEFKASELAAAEGSKFADGFADGGMTQSGDFGAFQDGSAVTYMLSNGTYDDTFFLDVGSRFFTNETSDPPTENFGTAPFETYFESLSKVPEASLAFFGGADRDVRAEYFIEERAWLDDGRAVSDVVRAGATSVRGGEGVVGAEQAAWLASAAVHHFSTRDEVPEGAKEPLAEVIATYMDGVGQNADGADSTLWPYAYLRDNPKAWEEDGEIHYGAAFKTTELNSVLRDLATNDRAAATIIDGAAQYQEYILNSSVTNWNSGAIGSEGVKNAAMESAALEGYLQETFALSARQVGQDEDDRAQFYVNGSAAAASGLLNVGPIGVGTLAGFVFQSGLAGQIDKWTGNESAAQLAGDTAKEQGITNLKLRMATKIGSSPILPEDVRTGGGGLPHPWFATDGFDASLLDDPDIARNWTNWVDDEDAGVLLQDLMPDVGTKFEEGVKRAGI